MRKLVLFFFVLLFLSACTLGSDSYVVQFDSGCSWEDLLLEEYDLILENARFALVVVELDSSLATSLAEDACVLRMNTKDDSAFLERIQSDLDEDRDDRIRDANLERTLVERDIIDRDQLQAELESENPEEEWPGGVISAYQLYVDPDSSAVQQLVSQHDGIEEIYAASLEWVWIADTVLHNEEEHWMYPEEFLTESAGLSTNPTGEIASDCEEQANTLASALIANGYSEQDVRVVLGYVNFGESSGGHAWVQVYENSHWIDVEATAGNYYGEETGYVEVTTDIPWNYFEYVTYPSEEIWVYYNNLYYHDAERNSGNAPSHWDEQGGSHLQDVQQGRRGPRAAQGAATFRLGERQAVEQYYLNR